MHDGRATPLASPWFLLLALCAPACSAPEPPSCEVAPGLPVFPGAEGPRIVVFRVAGTITLASHLDVLEPFITIAGQTAPGDGILVNGHGLVIFTHDVLIQHLRFRPGNFSSVQPDHNDAIAILGAEAGAGQDAYNIVLDHVSASWGEDENVSSQFGAHHITLSWSIVSEALDESRHDKGTHSAGLYFGDGTTCTSVHHTLLAHNAFRNPLLATRGLHDVVNNVIYDWRDIATEILPIGTITQANLVANCYRAGPSTSTAPLEVIYHQGDVAHFVLDSTALLNPAGRPELFVEGNIGPHRPDASVDHWAIVGDTWGETIAPETYRMRQRIAAAPVLATSAEVACQAVLEGAGATRPRRDGIDSRVVDEVRAGTGGIIDDPAEVGGFPAMAPGDAPPDADHDGMPDAWEITQGLDPADPADAAGDLDGDGYTNVEEWLHSLLEAP